MPAIPAEVLKGLNVTKVRYTNWRGETRVRDIVIQKVHFGSTNWHPKPQYLVQALDPEDGEVKDFALEGCDFVNVDMSSEQMMFIIDNMDEETINNVQHELDLRLKNLVFQRTGKAYD